MDNENFQDVERKMKRYHQEHLLNYYNRLQDDELKSKFEK